MYDHLRLASSDGASVEPRSARTGNDTNPWSNSGDRNQNDTEVSMMTNYTCEELNYAETTSFRDDGTRRSRPLKVRDEIEILVFRVRRLRRRFFSPTQFCRDFVDPRRDALARRSILGRSSAHRDDDFLKALERRFECVVLDALRYLAPWITSLER